MSLVSVTDRSKPQTWATRYRDVRRFSEQICQSLTPEDCAIQSMPDVSPTRWHLAHTTWFFETFLLSQCPGYEVFDPDFAYLFNSYYNTLGKQFSRSKRGLLSRPGLEEVLSWRHYVDRHVLDALQSNDSLNPEALPILEVGLHHEQQHQELMLTDIKHVFSCNPIRPVYRDGTFGVSGKTDSDQWIRFEEGVYEIGHEGEGFAFDNERPRHRAFLEAFELRSDLTTCGEYLQFIEEGGYQRPEYWLSMGWQTVCDQGWQAPLYWFREGSRWREFTLAGVRDVDPLAPVAHVSFFEADAFARWAGWRLPTEAEWEVAAARAPRGGNFVDALCATNLAIHPQGTANANEPLRNAYGDVWEWTASAYRPYPGYTLPDGALGEYNGKFMCNQFVLRGGSCATPSTHIRPTYRNFFPPEARWQFTGIRLARSPRHPQH